VRTETAECIVNQKGVERLQGDFGRCSPAAHLSLSLSLLLVSLQPFYTTRVIAADIDTRVKLLGQTDQSLEEGPGEKSKAGFWEEFDVSLFARFSSGSVQLLRRRYTATVWSDACATLNLQSRFRAHVCCTKQQQQ